MTGKIKSAVILAAGLGFRLEGRTGEKPKGFLTVGGEAIIKRSIANLLENGIEKIIIGTGYASAAYEELAAMSERIVCIKNSQFRDTGSMFTLFNAKDGIAGDFLLLESNLVYDKNGLKSLLEDPFHSIILSSGLTSASDGVYIEADESGYLVNMSKRPGALARVSSELVGISKISGAAFKAMCSFAKSRFNDEPKLDYEYALVGISRETKILVKKLEGYLWGEIDDEAHLKRVSEIVLPKIKEAELHERS